MLEVLGYLGPCKYCDPPGGWVRVSIVFSTCFLLNISCLFVQPKDKKPFVKVTIYVSGQHPT